MTLPEAIVFSFTAIVLGSVARTWIKAMQGVPLPLIEECTVPLFGPDAWQPAEAPPDVRARDLEAVIVACRSGPDRSWNVFGAFYLSEYPLIDLDDDEAPFTGFAIDYSNSSDEATYEWIDVAFWMRMPAPPAEAKPLVASRLGTLPW